MGQEQDEEQIYHRKFAADLFNYVWSLLDKTQRTREENDSMVHAAHASRYHWEKVGGPVNIARGEWQISRVYSVLNRPEPALYHANRCLAVCQENQIGDFDLAYAYEAIVRAFAIAGKAGDCQYYMDMAIENGRKIKDEDDRTMFFQDLNTIPGCGQVEGT